MTWDCTLGDTPWSSMQAHGLLHHLMRRALSQEEGERGEYVYVFAYFDLNRFYYWTQ